MKNLLLLLIGLTVVSPPLWAQGLSLEEQVEQGIDLPIEELFPPLPLAEKLELFLKGKKFESNCVVTQMPPGAQGKPKYLSYRYIYEFDGEQGQDQVVHRWVQLFSKEGCKNQ